ncbi:MAG TPA: GTP cyclohydrolase FolE2 [Candidatus Saccharimonadia bacterium]|nr:GTP cyclohydrolase FolE2 [Candidatus Saccharimonadia bacterium]
MSTTGDLVMPPPTRNEQTLPDVARDAAPAAAAAALDWVGMRGIELPVTLAGAATGSTRARVAAGVNLLRPEMRGIHMSRLYLHVDRALSSEPLTPCLVRRTLKDFLATHEGVSDRASLRIELDWLARRPALVSDNSGWKAYPVRISGVLERGCFTLELGLRVLYSSTCPASAALARQLVQQSFVRDFPAHAPPDHAAQLAWLGAAHAATPHAQRSTAELRMRLVPSFGGFPIAELIDAVESALGTPVQTAVKREDEQAFARLNGENLMFCEDAARRIHAVLDADGRIADFIVRATHHESLHAHDAVAVATKGISGGYAGAHETGAAFDC